MKTFIALIFIMLNIFPATFAAERDLEIFDGTNTTAKSYIDIMPPDVKPEQVGEKLRYLIDKKFFVGAAGVVFGQFARCTPKAKLQKILKETAPEFGVPVFNGYPFGHIPNLYSIDFCRKVEIKDGSVVFPAVNAK